MEDIIEISPEEAYPPITKDGQVMFTNTGDNLIDKWEKQLAEGKKVTIEDDFGNSEEVKKWLSAKKPKPEEMPPDVHDDFTKDVTRGR